MKMPEKHDPLAAILRQRNKASGQSLRLQWRACTMADARRCVYKNSNRRNDVRHYRLIIAPFSTSAGLSSTLGEHNECFIGHIGTDSIGSLIKRFCQKAGVEDGRNQ